MNMRKYSIRVFLAIRRLSVAVAKGGGKTGRRLVGEAVEGGERRLLVAVGDVEAALAGADGAGEPPVEDYPGYEVEHQDGEGAQVA